MESRSTKRRYGVIGVPVSKGQCHDGPQLTPNVMRENGLIEKLRRDGNDFMDYGNVAINVVDPDYHEIVKNAMSVANATSATADKVEQILRANEGCLAVGGDHSMSIGTVIGHARVDPNLVVLWVDAHADINTPLTSTSGNAHGMVLSFLTHELRRYVPRLPGWDNVAPCISCSKIAWIGLRSVDTGERKIIDHFGMNAFSMEQIDHHGLKAVLDKALKAVDPKETCPIHVSFDIDAMDPTLTPSTGIPVVGGLTNREMFCIAEEIAKTGRLRMLDVAEVNPKLGTNEEIDKTLRATINVVRQFFGSPRKGSYPNGYRIPIPEASL